MAFILFYSFFVNFYYTSITVSVSPSSVLKDNGDGTYLYFTSSLDLLENPQSWWSQIQPVSDLQISEEGRVTNIWIGRRGIVTSTHYDATYNFFIQLQGKKRFTLIPPTESMYLYPCLHPHYGHSQVNISLSETLEDQVKVLSQFPAFEGSKAVTVDVEAGQMLFVPPFWFHQVETTGTESVSVNIWSDAEEYQLINRAYGLPIPFEESWDRPTFVFACTYFTNLLVETLAASSELYLFSTKRLDGDTNWFGSHTRAFILDLVDQRYRVLYASSEIEKDELVMSEVKSLCNSAKSRLLKDLELSLSSLSSSSSSQNEAEATTTSHFTSSHAHFLKHMETVAISSERLNFTAIHSTTQQLLQIFEQIKEKSILSVLLGNYLEHLIDALLGVNSVYPFFLYCF